MPRPASINSSPGHPPPTRTLEPVIAAILIANAVFNVFAWPTFLRRVMKDPRARDASGSATAFLKVHIVLVTIALALAALSAVASVLIITGVW